MELFAAASATGGEELAAAEEARGVEGVVEAGHGGQVVVVEHAIHEANFFQADAVLAGDTAPAVETFLEDFATGREHAPDFIRVAFIEKQDRVKVTVAGVKDVDDADVVFRADRADPREDVGKLSARDDAILRAIAGAEAADRAEGLLAGFPELQPFFGVFGEADFAGAMLSAYGGNTITLGIEADFETIDFDEEDCFRIERKAEVERFFDGDKDALIHHFERGGNDARADDAADGLSGVVNRIEDAEHRSAALRVAGEADPDFGDDAEGAFAADDRADEIGAEGIRGGATDLGDFALGGDKLDA